MQKFDYMVQMVLERSSLPWPSYGKRIFSPFIEVNCAAIPNELIESELFGHEKGFYWSSKR